MGVLDLKLTDASVIALAAILNKNGRPLMFYFTKSPRNSELKHVSIEKDPEAQAKREHVKRFFSTGRDFIVNTHQKSVFYMFDNHY